MSDNLAQMTSQMHHYREEIALFRRQLAMSYNIEQVNKLEDDIRVKARYLERLYEENTALKAWKQQDDK